MKKIIKILLIVIPIIIVAVVFSIMSMKKKTSNIDEELLKITCKSGTYYDLTLKERRLLPIKKDSVLDCKLSVHSPLKKSLTYDYIAFDYLIEGDYEYVEKPQMTGNLLLYNDKDVQIIFTKENTINKEVKQEIIYANLYSFKIRIKDDTKDKLTFKLSNIRIENKKNEYILPDYTISYDIEK